MVLVAVGSATVGFHCTRFTWSGYGTDGMHKRPQTLMKSVIATHPDVQSTKGAPA